MSFVQRFRDSSLGSYLPVTNDEHHTGEIEEMGDLLNKEAAIDEQEEKTPHEVPQWQQPAPRSSAMTVLRNVGYELIPSFFRSSNKEEKLSQTAFLDGARGIAAFFVMHQHILQSWTQAHFYGFTGPGCWSFFQLPFIRLFANGAAMVLMFFAISGYSLSIGPLSARRDAGTEKMLASVSSSLFRRFIRLFLPPLTVTFISIHMIYFGMYEPNRAFHAQLPSGPDPFPPRFDSYWEQVGSWAHMVQNMVYNFSWDSDFPIYDIHLWTIRTEFMSSLALYLVMVCTARIVKPSVRLSVIFIIVLYAVYFGRWEIYTFVGGLFIAETDIVRDVYRRQQQAVSSSLASAAAAVATPTGLAFLRTRRGIFYLVNFLCALFLLSTPPHAPDTTAIWGWLYWLLPYWWREPGRAPVAMIGFWYSIGAFQLIWVCSNCPPFRKVFTNKFAQYLGKISYALYIVHGPVLYTVGDGAAQFMQGLIGRDTFVRVWIVIGFEYVCFMPALFIVSDIVWRLVDAKSVKLAKWVQGKCFA